MRHFSWEHNIPAGSEKESRAMVDDHLDDEFDAEDNQTLPLWKKKLNQYQNCK